MVRDALCLGFDYQYSAWLQSNDGVYTTTNGYE